MSSPDSPAAPPDFAELQVPGEPGVWYCARHKKVKTRLRCGRCEKPICPQCTVMAPTGARCHDCASNRHSHLYKASPAQFLISFACSVVLGAAGLAATHLLAGMWFLLFFIGPALVPLLGNLVTRITGGKKGPVLAAVVSFGLVLGAIGSALGSTLGLAFRVGSTSAAGQILLFSAFSDPFLWVFLVLAVVGVWWWLK